jgi:hypothetical protein
VPGIEADLDLGPIEVMAKLGVELGKLNRHNEEFYRHQEWQRSRVPSYVPQFTNTTINASGARQGFGFTGPRAGYYMILRRLIIGGLTWKTAAAGTSEVYVTGLPSGAIAGLSLADMVDQSPFLPNKAYYSNQQVYVNAGQHVEMVIDSGTPGQQYVAGALFEVWRMLSGENVFTP